MTYGCATHYSEIKCTVISRSLAVPVDKQLFRNVQILSQTHVLALSSYGTLGLPRQLLHEPAPSTSPSAAICLGFDVHLRGVDSLSLAALPLTNWLPASVDICSVVLKTRPLKERYQQESQARIMAQTPCRCFKSLL
jgi:hypothetical protein